MTVTYAHGWPSNHSVIYNNDLAYADGMPTAFVYVMNNRLYTATTYLMRSACGQHSRFVKIKKRVFTFSQNPKNRLYISTTYAMPLLLLLLHILRTIINLFAHAREAKILKISKARAA